MHHPKLEELVRRDPRYAYEAYEFVFAALSHTLQLLGRKAPEPGASEEPHVTGPQLLEGARDLALREFGLMARTVFKLWGINRTDDFGEIVFNLVEAELMSKTDEDDRLDFRGVFDLDEALVKNYQIELPPDEEDS
jgi:uncharacterized repeat protein (TIGR04138 family)